MYLLEDEVVLADPRGIEEDRLAVINRLEIEHAWPHLGAQGRRIREVQQGIDLDNERAAHQAWDAYLRKHIKLPLEASVIEVLDIDDLDMDDIVYVIVFAPLDEFEGVMVQVKRREWQGVVPLLDLEPTKSRSANYRVLDDYLVWYLEI